MDRWSGTADGGAGGVDRILLVHTESRFSIPTGIHQAEIQLSFGYVLNGEPVPPRDIACRVQRQECGCQSVGLDGGRDLARGPTDLGHVSPLGGARALENDLRLAEIVQVEVDGAD